MSTEQLRDRFRGAIVGTALGDALGAPFEGHPTVEPRAFAHWAASDEPLTWTDDTAMTLAVAESLVAVGGFDGADMARRFVAAYEAEPWRGYGPGPPQVFAALRKGAPWHQPARRLFGGTGSFGNGAAMRAAPIGLFAHRRPEGLVVAAEGSARITHAHPQGRQGAVWQARAVAWLVGRRHLDLTANTNGLLASLDDVVFEEALTRRLSWIRTADPVHAADPDLHQRAIDALGNGIAAAESVPSALFALLRGPESAPSAIEHAVLFGGDTDTIAAMAGAMAGALHGYRSLPSTWLQRLEQHTRLVGVADELVETTMRRTAAS